jgi:uncharacterized protein (DUF1800 family)
MPINLADLIKHPSTAWEPWQPSDTEPWDHSRVCLLMRRGGFGITGEQIQAALKVEPQAFVTQLVDAAKSVDSRSSFESESASLASSIRASGDMNKLASWWLHRMLNSPTPLVEKLTLFWHGHFATGAEKVLDVELMYEQNQLLRKYCLGDFRQMVHAISKDPAMLIYLDSVTNRKAHANENYARELMELFCLGEGNYSEADVQELAKCFTGWEIRRKQFRFNAYQHDDSEKTLLGKKDIKSGEEAIDVVLASEHMPRFIVYKLYKYFVCDEPEPTSELLEPLVKVFVDHQFSIGPVVRTILGSRLFLSGWSLGRRVRSPVELVMEVLRAMKGSVNLTKLADRMKPLGQSLFFPPNVKGWPGGRTWINSSTLIGRANLLYDLLNDENTRFAGDSLASFSRSVGADNTQEWIRWWTSMLMAVELPERDRQSILNKVESMPKDQQIKQSILELATLPRIHLS